jgi:hypothetical protein
MERGRPPKIICQLDVVHDLPTKLPQKLLDEKSLLFSIYPTDGFDTSRTYSLLKL